jgi:hypothetical protein
VVGLIMLGTVLRTIAVRAAGSHKSSPTYYIMIFDVRGTYSAHRREVRDALVIASWIAGSADLPYPICVVRTVSDTVLHTVDIPHPGIDDT